VNEFTDAGIAVENTGGNDAMRPTLSMAETAIKLNELISDKRYVLGIKEKRSTPFLTLGVLKPKASPKHKSVKLAKSTVTVGGADVDAKTKYTKMAKVFILLLLVAGVYLAFKLDLFNIG
jgi:hypothetical protein